MKIVFDLHTHTLVSGHAYSTLAENIACAKEQGLLAYGHSEHAENMPGSVTNLHFTNFKVIPKEIHGIKIFGGVEANIIDFDGNIDCDSKVLEKVDYVIASLHPPCIKPGTIDENTNAILKVMENEFVKIIGHPDDSRFPLDLDKVTKKANETGTIIEINNSSLNPLSTRVNGRANVAKLLEACNKNQTKVILNTDSHYCGQVGKFDEALELMNDVGFNMDLVINTSLDGLKYVLNK